MPVPIPLRTKPVAVKHVNSGSSRTSPLYKVTRTLPLSPTVPPPAYGTREQWINSLPTWRRVKLRRNFDEDSRTTDTHPPRCGSPGMTISADQPETGKESSGSCFPSYHSLFFSYQPCVRPHSAALDDDADNLPSSENSPLESCHLDHFSQWSASSPHSETNDDVGHAESDCWAFDTRERCYPSQEDDGIVHSRACEDGFSDRFACEDKSCNLVQSITPFADYIDRAVAPVDHLSNTGNVSSDCGSSQEPLFEEPGLPFAYPSIAGQFKEPVLTRAPEISTPIVNIGYKKLAESFAEWVVSYIWKVCTTGLSLPSSYVQPLQYPVPLYPTVPPSHLVASVHHLLLSTLLQPTAVLLAIWYITRLPVYFPAAPLSPEFIKEGRFRAALFGDVRSPYNREAMEAGAPFRLIVLGCMLANKWLDDHTFSNKTWHSISNIPIQALNQLESLSLDIFAYDLSIPSGDWCNWLTDVMSYHTSLISPNLPQPISRPSCNPHSIIRRVIEEILQAPVACKSTSSPEPFFIGLDERKRGKLEREQSIAAEDLEIDLDEDGPLRAEYLPKRRSISHSTLPLLQAKEINSWESQGTETGLPPPARWSPAGDEPIYPERSRARNYVAVQPQFFHSVKPYPLYIPAVEPPHTSWNFASTYTSMDPHAMYQFSQPLTDVGKIFSCDLYSNPAQIINSRSRSHSYEFESFECQRVQNHNICTCSQAPSHHCGDSYTKATQLHPHWYCQPYYPYSGAAFTPLHSIHYLPPGVRV